MLVVLRNDCTRNSKCWFGHAHIQRQTKRANCWSCEVIWIFAILNMIQNAMHFVLNYLDDLHCLGNNCEDICYACCGSLENPIQKFVL
jgi:hypothetical protein